MYTIKIFWKHRYEFFIISFETENKLSKHCQKLLDILKIFEPYLVTMCVNICLKLINNFVLNIILLFYKVNADKYDFECFAMSYKKAHLRYR